MQQINVNYNDTNLLLLALTIGILSFQSIYLLTNFALLKRQEYLWFSLSNITMVFLYFIALKEKNYLEIFLDKDLKGIFLYGIVIFFYYQFLYHLFEIRKKDKVLYNIYVAIQSLTIIMICCKFIPTAYNFESDFFIKLYTLISSIIYFLSFILAWLLIKFKNKELAIIIFISIISYNIFLAFAQSNLFKAVFKISYEKNTSFFFLLGDIVECLLVMFALSYKTKLLNDESLITQKQLSETKLVILKEQIKPHFIFNCLNAVNRFIVGDETEKASNFLLKVSKLIRIITNKGDLNYISLEEELDFCKNYVEVESMRMGKDFRYFENIASNINLKNINIPTLILQTFFENAIHHGLASKSGDRILKCTVELDHNRYKISIEDNGVGRQNKVTDAKMENVTGRGLKITRDRFEIMSKLRGTENYFKIIDLLDQESKGIGTRVEIFLEA